MPAEEYRKSIAYLFVFLCGVLWGLTFSLARIATSEGAHPIGLSFWQAAGGAVFLLSIGIFRNKFPSLDRVSLVRYTIIGLIGTVIPGTLYFYAASRVPAGILAITVTLAPMLTYAATLGLGADVYERKRLIGIFLGFIAILFLIIPESSLPNPGIVPWILLALLCCVFYTVENIYVDIVVPDHLDMIVLLTGGTIVASIWLMPVLYVFDFWVPLQIPFTKIEWAIVAMSVASVSAYAMFFLLIKMAGSVFASMVAYAVTIAGVFLGVLIFDESHSLWVWTSFALMLLGTGLVKPRERVIEKNIA